MTRDITRPGGKCASDYNRPNGRASIARRRREYQLQTQEEVVL